ncbi:Eisosome component PIL1-domain-containing protein, partial [Roridomyces roridus]
IGQQYTSTTPVQKIITVEKSVALDLDALARDAKAQSKEIYTWGQTEDADIKDVTDRLAYLNFVQGSLANSLAVKLDAARTSLKNLRDAEAALIPRRNLRAGYQTQISRIETDKPHGLDKRLIELKEQLRKAEAEDEPAENQPFRESEKHKWEAIREYGEKLVLLSQAATPIIDALPRADKATGAARASLQRALDNYKTGHIHLPHLSTGADLSRSETRSFGESHARELSSIASESSHTDESTLPVTPPSGDAKELPAHSQSPPPLDPSTLNLSPAPIPGANLSVPATSDSTGTPELPTVAETGVPVSAGADGPGPASGSLRDIHAASSSAGPRSGGLPGNDSTTPAYGSSSGKYESAAEEKRRLREYSEAVQSPPPVVRESAEDEKKRLEREQRERLFDAGPSGSGPDDLPPSYQE